MDEPRRLHWGCGDVRPDGWINSDLAEGPGIDISCSIFDGLPLDDDSIDYITSQHTLPEIRIYEQVAALTELRRVLKPGGVLRMSLPDLDLFIDAYRSGRREAFHIWDWDSVSGNFITHMLWYNTIHTPFTYEFAEELMRKAGFREVRRVGYRETMSGHPEIVELDNRPDESFYVEAVK
jgi:ubiquinone/menaquinone biosynthesis C-methylase UbiE